MMIKGSTRKLFLFFIALIAFAIVIFSLSSIMGITELLHPIKVDSAYMAASFQKASAERNETDTLRFENYYFKPGQLNLDYEPFQVGTIDSLLLEGWYYRPKYDESGITILVVHDLNESKINYMEAAKAFTERGFRVCCMDMRACGESQGNYFTFGTLIGNDISNIMDSLFCRPETNHLALFGVGTGAANALQTASFDNRPVALVLENCFASLTAYFSRYAIKKWGRPGKWFFSQMKSELDKQMGFNSDSLNLQDKISQINTPTLFIAKAGESLEDLKETHLLFESSPAEKKEFLFFREFTKRKAEAEQEKAYYDKISAFISTSVPAKEKRTRFKKLVINQ